MQPFTNHPLMQPARAAATEAGASPAVADDDSTTATIRDLRNRFPTTEGADGTNHEVPETVLRRIPKSIDDFKTSRFFSPQEVACGFHKPLAEIISKDFGLDLVLNYTPPVPDGYELVVSPLTERSEKKGEARKVKAAVIGAIPTLETVLDQGKQQGSDYVVDTIRQAFRSTLAQSAKAKIEDNSTTLPLSIADFVESKRGAGLTEGMAVAKRVLGPFVKKMHRKGFKFLTVPLFISCLRNQNTANQLFPKYTSEQWDGLLQNLIKLEEKGEDVTIFRHWLNTRHKVEEAPEGPDLDDVFSEMEDEEEEQEATAAE